MAGKIDRKSKRLDIYVERLLDLLIEIWLVFFTANP